MPDFFDILFGKGATPVRRDARVRLRQDADGNPVIEPIDGKSISLSGEGSIDGMEIVPDRFYHCGCNAQSPMGGQCAEPGCGNVSCATCFGRCASCLSPLCLEHSRYLFGDQGKTVKLCHRCYDNARRVQIYKSVVTGLLSPFISFDSDGKRE